MQSSHSVSQLIDVLKADDVSLAQTELWNRYYADLVLRVAHRLGRRYCTAADEEDIALSAMNSFFRGLRAGSFPDLRNRSELWNLLLTIAYRKVIKQHRREQCAKRGGGAVRNEASFAAGDSDDGASPLDVADGPSEDDLALAAEELTEGLGDPILRTIVVRRLQGFTDREIAQLLGVAERTVIRKRQRIQSIWQSELIG
jgi:DNA-directed RNA polymerase specialized sigma24 family protein